MTVKIDPGNLVVEWDRDAKAAYITLSKNKVARTIEVALNIHVDLDSKGRLVGVEWILSDEHLRPMLFKKRFDNIARRFKSPAIRRAAKVIPALVEA